MSDIEIDAQHPATILAGSPVVEVLTFSGRPDEDVTLFLQNVKRIAFAQGRQKDEGWLADYVETCLAGAALRWFSELEDTAGDQSWKVLRRAFLERFEPVANPQPSAAAPGSSSSSPSASARSLVPQPISSVPHPSSILRTSPSTNTEVMKTILIGDTGVGKSSLLSRILSYGRAPPSIEPTNGVDYETWSGMLGEKKYQRHFWDTSGATQVRALTISFIPDVTSIFLVFDVTNQRSLKCVRDWHRVIQSRISSGTRITLMGNKCDLRDGKAVSHVSHMQCLAVAQEMGARYFEVSAKTNEGVQDIWGGWLPQMKLMI